MKSRQVKIRKLKQSIPTQWVFLMLTLLLVACRSGNNIQSAEPEWRSIFNGNDLAGWTVKMNGFELNTNFNNTFRVEDSMLVVSYDQYEDFNREFGHIFYSEILSHYKLRIEYRFIGEQVPGGEGWAFRNSGIMLHCQSPETMEVDQPFPVSIEAQMLGGNGTDLRTTANVCTPGTHIEMDGELITEHCIESKSKTFHGDQWVTMEVEVRGDSLLKHFVNSELVFTYEKPQLDQEDEYAMKLLDKGHGISLTEGYISLQAESHPLQFRKIELMELK